MAQDLPIETILPDLIATLRRNGRAVLQAPPGAGKTTRVPLALAQAGLCKGRILMLEPRRLAARAAAERMADTLGEKTGQTVGYRIRGQSSTSTATQIEVVTEGILTRMLQDDPELPGIGAVIFDEFHERSLNADLGLALCLEVADALRDDLILVAMSATLDAEPVAHLMNAPVITSEGRSFPVEQIWLERPKPKDHRFEHAVADLTRHALRHTSGSVLVFLPGEGEIRRTEALLAPEMTPETTVHPLYGALDFTKQRAAIAPARTGRKVVLATSIAETSLTIEGITVVVDGGRARRSEFDPTSGMARLVTTRVSKAEAAQRAGRAGRLSAGVCYKLWTRGEDGALPAYPPAEIDSSDLTGFALEIAQWGGRAEEMRFVTPPHPGRLAEAREVLRMLGALDETGRITAHGRELVALPLHPRLAHMVVRGGPTAPLLAALLAERDILRGAEADLTLRLKVLKGDRQAPGGVQPHQPTVHRIKEEARRLKRMASGGGPDDTATLAALAYPDRVGMRRAGDAPRFILSGGKGAVLPKEDPLSSAAFLVATDLDGDPREARIRQAVALPLADLRDLFADQIQGVSLCEWSRRERKVLARQQERFGALVLSDKPWRNAPAEKMSEAMLDGVRHLGLAPSPRARRLMDRAALLRQSDQSFPDLSEEALLREAENWLLPFLGALSTADDWKKFDIAPALEAWIGWEAMQRLDADVPAKFETPLGRSIAIEYDDGKPKIALRLQELFGVTHHPEAAGVPLQITLLSPAHRPVQVTEDLPRFWATSYADVRKDMRGRYPKHPWPEDPTQADPTLRATRRKT